MGLKFPEKLKGQRDKERGGQGDRRLEDLDMVRDGNGETTVVEDWEAGG